MLGPTDIRKATPQLAASPTGKDVSAGCPTANEQPHGRILKPGLPLPRSLLGPGPVAAFRGHLRPVTKDKVGPAGWKCACVLLVNAPTWGIGDPDSRCCSGAGPDPSPGKAPTIRLLWGRPASVSPVGVVSLCINNYLFLRPESLTR